MTSAVDESLNPPAIGGGRGWKEEEDAPVKAGEEDIRGSFWETSARIPLETSISTAETAEERRPGLRERCRFLLPFVIVGGGGEGGDGKQ